MPLHVAFKTDNIKILADKMRARKEKYKGGVKQALNVGYFAPYALYVHENLQAVHLNGQAKFLEQPARRLNSQIVRIIRAKILIGATLTEALKEAGNYLLSESRKLVPVDTGYLRATGFVRIEPEL